MPDIRAVIVGVPTTPFIVIAGVPVAGHDVGVKIACRYRHPLAAVHAALPPAAQSFRYPSIGFVNGLGDVVSAKASKIQRPEKVFGGVCSACTLAAGSLPSELRHQKVCISAAGRAVGILPADHAVRAFCDYHRQTIVILKK